MGQGIARAILEKNIKEEHNAFITHFNTYSYKYKLCYNTLQWLKNVALLKLHTHLPKHTNKAINQEDSVRTMVIRIDIVMEKNRSQYI